MSIFTGIFHSRDKPQNSLGGSRYSFFFGGTTAGKPVNEQTAMQMTAVYSCVRILSETLAGMPLHVYKYNDSGGKEKDLKHPLYKLLHDEPNPEMTSFAFRETLMSHLLLWGNAYAQIIRNARGEVVALYPLMPNKMTVDRDSKGRLYYLYQRSTEDAHTLGSDVQVYLAPSDVLHIPGLGFDGLVGYSPIAMAKNAVGLAIATEEYGAKFFANGAAPGGVLEHPGTIKDPQKVKESWNSAYARVSLDTSNMLHSLSAQISYYNDYIQRNPAWAFAGIYADANFSGALMNRPEFQRLLEDCRLGKIDIIITKSVSRFARNTAVLLQTVRELKSLVVDTQYDADNQILSIKGFELHQSPENGDCFCNYSLPIRGESHDDISTYEIWQLGLESEFDDTEIKNYLSKGINLNPSEAKQLDNDIGVLIICSTVNSVKPLAVLSSDDYLTKGDSKRISYIKRTLNVNINSIWLFEKSTGKIIYKSAVS